MNPAIIQEYEGLSDSAPNAAIERAFNTIKGSNLGHTTLMANMPIKEFFSISSVANIETVDPEEVAQRALDIHHAKNLAIYMLKGLIRCAETKLKANGIATPARVSAIIDYFGTAPYFAVQPIVANIRNVPFGGGKAHDLKTKAVKADDGTIVCTKVVLEYPKHTLWVIDGQHRRVGMGLIFDFLEEVLQRKVYPKSGQPHSPFKADNDIPNTDEIGFWTECELMAQKCSVAVELHLGLDVQQEKQLFYDLNQLGKKVGKGLAGSFDSANPVNLFIKRIEQELGLKVTEDDTVDLKIDDGRIPRKDVVAVNQVLLLNNRSVKHVNHSDIEPKIEDAINFWTAILLIKDFGQIGARAKTVASQSPVLKALAKVYYDVAFNKRSANPKEQKKFLNNLQNIDFSHSNPMWRYFSLNKTQRAQSGLSGLDQYLGEVPVDVQQEFRKSATGTISFGSRHNDSFPVIADMIRWSLKLPRKSNETGQ